MGPKRAKPDDSSSDSSLSESKEAVMDEGENKHLCDISTKLSLILTAIHDLTDAVRETNKKILPETTEAVSEISKVIREMDVKIKPAFSRTSEGSEEMETSVNSCFEAEALKVKARLAALWERKLGARKEAYWSTVRDQGNLEFHEKWIQMTPIIIPRKIQKFEYHNENESQRMLRERSVLHDYKMEIEMEKLRVSACQEKVRKIDTEMEEIVFSKCSGQVADFVLDLWKKQVKRNEEISHKRWLNNVRWLNSYEEEFKQKYANSNPFFKPQDTYSENREFSRPQNRNFSRPQNRTYADAVKSNRPPVKPYVQNTQNEIQGLLRQLISKFNNNSNTRQNPNNNKYNNNYRRPNHKGYTTNRSNNSGNEEDEVVTPATIDDFLEIGEDHNWRNVH